MREAPVPFPEETMPGQMGGGMGLAELGDGSAGKGPPGNWANLPPTEIVRDSQRMPWTEGQFILDGFLTSAPIKIDLSQELGIVKSS
jgi:hypothetical protein